MGADLKHPRPHLGALIRRTLTVTFRVRGLARLVSLDTRTSAYFNGCA